MAAALRVLGRNIFLLSTKRKPLTLSLCTFARFKKDGWEFSLEGCAPPDCGRPERRRLAELEVRMPRFYDDCYVFISHLDSGIRFSFNAYDALRKWLEEKSSHDPLAIVKSGDDCRQEHLAVQLISHFYDIFQEAGLPLWLRPYEVLVTSSYTALIETLPDTASLHSIKSRYPNISSLRDFFVAKYEEKSPSFELAQLCFLDKWLAHTEFQSHFLFDKPELSGFQIEVVAVHEQGNLFNCGIYVIQYMRLIH